MNKYKISDSVVLIGNTINKHWLNKYKVAMLPKFMSVSSTAELRVCQTLCSRPDSSAVQAVSSPDELSLQFQSTCLHIPRLSTSTALCQPEGNTAH